METKRSKESAQTKKQLSRLVAYAIEEKLKENSTDKRFPNRVLRNEIFSLLDQFCTVVFYPLLEENNNGFHKTYIVHGKEEQFVFINTAKQNCLQVFTAAHELGHIWNIVESVRQADEDQILTLYSDEEIINKFAAEFLMPETIFKDAYYLQYQEKIISGRNTGENVLKLIAELMHMFYVPGNSVIKRMNELELINDLSADILSGNTKAVSKTNIEENLERCLAVFGYQELMSCSNKKWIDQLPNMLKEAKISGCVTERKIKAIQETFEISEAMLEPINAPDFNAGI